MLILHALESEYPQHALKPDEMKSNLLGLLNRADPVDGKLPYILNIVEDLINQTQEGQKVLQTNFRTAVRIKNETELNYTTSQTNRRSACAALNSSAVQRNLNEAIRVEDEANETLQQAHISYSAALKAHKDQNVESEIQSLYWIRTLVYRLLTGTHMPTTSPTTSPTEPPTPSPTNPALSYLQVPNAKRMTIAPSSPTVWIDKDDNIICLGLCGITQHPSRTFVLKHYKKSVVPWVEQAMKNDSLTFSMVKYKDLIEEPIFVKDGPGWLDRPYRSPSNDAVFGMWGKVSTSMVPRLAGKKPVSVSIGNGLMVLYNDGSIWNHLFDWANFLLLQNVGFGVSQSAIQARDRITKMSGRGMWPNGPDWWFKVSEDTVFTRISNGRGDLGASFAWDINNDFYIFIDADEIFSHADKFLKKVFFYNCPYLFNDIARSKQMYWWWRWDGNEETINRTRGFVKWPRECYPTKGNVADVFSISDKIFLLFDKNGEKGNLWGYGACFWHQRFMDRDDPQYKSYPEEKFAPDLGNRLHGFDSWCQFGTNKRVTTMELFDHASAQSLVVATTTGVYCLGQNVKKLCDPHAPANYNSYYNWTKMVNQSVITAPIKKIHWQADGLLFLLENGQVWRRQVHPHGQPLWVGTDGFRVNFTHLQNKIGPIANIHLTARHSHSIVVTNHTGSHIHFGNSLYNCDWRRGSSGEFLYNTAEITLYDTPCGPADDMGPLDDKLLWLQ